MFLGKLLTYMQNTDYSKEKWFLLEAHPKFVRKFNTCDFYSYIR